MSAQRASQLVEAGLWLRLSGDQEGAKRLFEQALKLDPANARARQLLDSPPPQPVAPGSDAAPIAKSTMELDWGLATGMSPPEPEPPAPPPPLKPVTIPPPIAPLTSGSKHTVRLGEMPVEPPPSSRRLELDETDFGGLDDGAPRSSPTQVFGGSRMPLPRQPEPVPQSSTLMFGLNDHSAGSPGGTAGFTVPAGGTLVFNGLGQTQPPREPESTVPTSSTLVFGSMKHPTLPPPEPPRTSTMMFASLKPPEPPSAAALVPPPPTETIATQPGVPAFEVERPSDDEIEIEVTSEPSGNTLEFNFDDMVTEPTSVPDPISKLPWDEEPTKPSAIALEPPPAVPAAEAQTAWDRSNPRIDITAISSALGGDGGGGFDLISAAPPPAPKPRSPAQLKEEVSTLLSGAIDLLDLDDHSGAMELINKALELDPADANALKLKERSEHTLQTMFESKLGDLNQVPRVKLKDDEIIWLNLDHRAGFVLAQIDGSVTFEDLFAVSGMSRLDTARILAQLVEEGVITKG